MDPELLAQVTPELEEAVAAKADAEGKIACPMLRRIAEDHGVTYKVAGAAADSKRIKVRNCDLGCF
ncbi:MAG: hypothetical protein HY876_03790 [Coriobacteriales bacterium]|nr:hypothetical protein [Coriobacteriales bacterium]